MVHRVGNYDVTLANDTRVREVSRTINTDGFDSIVLNKQLPQLAKSSMQSPEFALKRFPSRIAGSVNRIHCSKMNMFSILGH
jgi:hypothetical protein